VSGHASAQDRQRRRPLAWWLVAGAMGGLAYAALGLLASEPAGRWWAAALACVPLVALSLTAADATRRGAIALAAGSALGSLPLWVVTHWWIAAGVSPVGFGPGMLLQGSWAGVFVLAGAAAAGRWRERPTRAALALGLAWGAVEAVRGQVLLGGYPWLLLGHPMIDAPRLGLAGAVVGAYGVGCLLAVSAAGAVLAFRTRRAGAVAAALAPWGALAGLALLAPPVGEATGVRAAAVQTNVPQHSRHDWTIERQVRSFARAATLTRRAAREGAGLIVWPETMLPGPPIGEQALAELRREGLVYATDLPGLERIPATAFADDLAAIQGELGVPVLVGAVAADGLELTEADDGAIRFSHDALHNSAHLVSEGRLLPQRYDKLKLTIFGEVIPLVSRWEWLERRLLAIGARGMAFDLSPGERAVWFDLPTTPRPLRVGTPICFEIAFSGVCRRLASGGGERVHALVNLTNDGWFGQSDGGRAAHLQLARWRALELGVPIVRAANTGLSAIIDARGKLVSALPEQDADGQADGQTDGQTDGGRVRTGGAELPTRVAGVVAGQVPGRTVRPTPYTLGGHATPWVLLAGGVGAIALGLRGRSGRTGAR